MHLRDGSAQTPVCTDVLFVGCLSSQQHASVPQGRIFSDNFTCCHTEIEAADLTFHLTQSQYTDTGPTSPSADPMTPGAWQGSHWSAKGDGAPLRSHGERGWGATEKGGGGSHGERGGVPRGKRRGGGGGVPTPVPQGKRASHIGLPLSNANGKRDFLASNRLVGQVVKTSRAANLGSVPAFTVYLSHIELQP